MKNKNCKSCESSKNNHLSELIILVNVVAILNFIVFPTYEHFVTLAIVISIESVMIFRKIETGRQVK